MSSVSDLLERLTPPVDAPADWDDVLRRAGPSTRRRRPSRSALAVAATVLALAVAVPAVGVGGRIASLIGHDSSPRPRLPAAAARGPVVIVVGPRSGQVLVIAAPMRKAEGVCWAFVGGERGCSRRSRRGWYVGFERPAGMTFDRRAVAAEAILASGRRVQLRFARFGGRIGAGFFVATWKLRETRTILLRDRAGTVIARIRGVPRR